MNGISGVMLTWNSQKNMRGVLANVMPNVDEMIVVDEGSTDDTVGIAREMGCRVITVPLKFHFGDKRNAGIMMCRYRWVIMVDDDETFEPGTFEYLRNLIADVTLSSRLQAVKFRRTNIVGGKRVDSDTEDIHIRFFLRSCRWVYSVHEELVGWKNSVVSPHSIVHNKTEEEHSRDNWFYSVIEAIGIDLPVDRVRTVGS